MISCSLFYYNFGKGLTPETRHTLLGRVKETAQFLTIPWFFVLTNWPAGISFYIMCNAIASVSQGMIQSTPWFLKKLNPKLLISQIVLHGKENEEIRSHNLYRAIKEGEENWYGMEVTEDQLFEETREILTKLKACKTEQDMVQYHSGFFGESR